jgi:hypothetical protein
MMASSVRLPPFAVIEGRAETQDRTRFDPVALDERPTRLREILGARSAAGNLLEALARANVLLQPHLLVKAIRASRGQLLDGSYALGLAPWGSTDGV